jgi:hypothetical protein
LQGAGVVWAWAASVAAGAVFHHWVEAPLGRFLAGLAKPVTVPTFGTKPVRLRG